MPLHTNSQEKGQLFALPEFGEGCAHTGVIAHQTDGYHIEFVAGQGSHPWVLPIDLHRAEKAVGMKGPYWQGAVEGAHRATAFLAFGWPGRSPRADARRWRSSACCVNRRWTRSTVCRPASSSSVSI